MLTSKPRHTRKHPLIIPPTSLQRTFQQFTITNPSSSAVLTARNITVDQIDGGNNDFDETAGGICVGDDTLKKSTDCDTESIHFEQRIDSELAALDNINDVNDFTVDNAKELLQSHHVSCEDLLEFADLKPNSRTRGNDSDEVRIMSKVLGGENVI